LRRRIDRAPTQAQRLACGLRRIGLAVESPDIPLKSYSDAAISACLLLIAADRARLAGHTGIAIARINQAADVMVDCARAARLLRPAPGAVTRRAR
jgi:hypothetical protein